MNGTLYIVATPIGNLEDISHRALRILNAVSLIAAEDTRHSKKLLQHYAIDSRLISLHDHNESQKTQLLTDKLQAGEDIALISDAGTPLISDPGYHLVNRCRQADIAVVPVPGACAAIAALSVSGLATDRFIFNGFLPVKQHAKTQAILELQQASATVVVYESPRRIVDTVGKIADLLGDQRKLVVARELTKQFEQLYSGFARDTLNWLLEDENHQRGEFVLMIAGVKQDPKAIPIQAKALLFTLMQTMPLKQAAAVVAEHYQLKKNALYQLGLEQQ